MAKRVNPDGTRRPKVRLRGRYSDKPTDPELRKAWRLDPMNTHGPMPRQSKEAKYLIEEQRHARKKTDLFARFRKLLRSTFKKDLPPGVKVK